MKNWLKAKLDDPESYNSVDFLFMDTTLINEHLSEKLKIIVTYNIPEMRKQIDLYSNVLRQNNYNKLYPEYKRIDEDSLKSKQMQLEKSIGDSSSISQSIQNNRTPSSVYEYRVLHHFRAKNKFGATVLSTYKFVLDDNYNVKSGWQLIE